MNLRILICLFSLFFSTAVSAQATDDLRKAAESGDPKSQYEFARQLERENAVTPKEAAVKEILEWYGKAADQGYLPAQEVLGLIYMKDTYVPKDFVIAYQWFYLAAEQNGPVAKPGLEVLTTLMTPEQIKSVTKLALDWKMRHP